MTIQRKVGKSVMQCEGVVSSPTSTAVEPASIVLNGGFSMAAKTGFNIRLGLQDVDSHLSFLDAEPKPVFVQHPELAYALMSLINGGGIEARFKETLFLYFFIGDSASCTTAFLANEIRKSKQLFEELARKTPPSQAWGAVNFIHWGSLIDKFLAGEFVIPLVGKNYYDTNQPFLGLFCRYRLAQRVEFVRTKYCEAFLDLESDVESMIYSVIELNGN